jgi:hypothetical protein
VGKVVPVVVVVVTPVGEGGTVTVVAALVVGVVPVAVGADVDGLAEIAHAIATATTSGSSGSDGVVTTDGMRVTVTSVSGPLERPVG